MNYVPTNDLILVSRFWKPGRSLTIKKRDDEARDVLRELFPGREIVQVYSENVNRGGGGMNCITQQQPASATFARMCGWAKVQVDVQVATLYASPFGQSCAGPVPRLTRSGGDIYLERLSSSGNRVRVRVVGRPGSTARSVGLMRMTSRARARNARPSTREIEAEATAPPREAPSASLALTPTNAILRNTFRGCRKHSPNY